jgi:predicted HTH transcriptional regulator
MTGEILVHLSDDDLLSRLTNTEDNFVERKRFSDDREWLRTVVAFANSCPIGYPGVLFIGVYDNGTVEQPGKPINLDSLQKTLTERCNEARGLRSISCPKFFVRMVNNS